jgi:hypothetical protein
VGVGVELAGWWGGVVGQHLLVVDMLQLTEATAGDVVLPCHHGAARSTPREEASRQAHQAVATTGSHDTLLALTQQRTYTRANSRCTILHLLAAGTNMRFQSKPASHCPAALHQAQPQPPP